MTIRRMLVVVAAALAVLSGLPAAASASTSVWAVGDGAASGPTDDEVGALVGAGPLDDFLYLGDVYSSGTVGDPLFKELFYYDEAFGSYKGKSYPTPGNHEWPNRALLTGYDAYWPQFSAPHYYSVDVGGWHVVSLNSEEAAGEGSEQLSWLQNDLAQHQGTCTLAFWHRPRYAATSLTDRGKALGDDARTPGTSALWDALKGHAALALAGHVHNYQRLKPIDGITEVVVGTGGEHAEHHTVTATDDPRLAAYDDTHFGALRLALEPGRADFDLIELSGGVLDSGSVACKTKPRATSAAAPDSPTTATLSGTVDPNGDATSYHFDYGTSPSYGSQTSEASAESADPQTISAPISGLLPSTTYHYRLVATNSLGTTEVADKTFMTPATLGVSIDSGPSGLTNQRTPTFGFHSNEGGGATFECSIYQGAADLGPCSGEGTHTPATSLVDAPYTFRVTVSDALGQSASETRAFTVDATAPATTIGSGPGGLTNDRTSTFAFSSNDAGATSTCRIDSDAFATCGSPLTTPSLTDGGHSVEVRSTDAAGNVGSAAARTFTVDGTLPRTTLIRHPAKKLRTTTRRKRVRFGFSGSDNRPATGPLRFQCRLDGGSFASCRSPFVRKVKLGSHRFSVQAMDAAGNVDATPASFRWRVVRKR